MTELSDPVRGDTEPTRYWTTANVGEAASDVMTPMCWSLWGPANEISARRSYHRFGVMDAGEVTHNEDQNKRITGVFYGRVAMNMDLILTYSGRLPGTSPRDFEMAMTGAVRPETTAVGDSSLKRKLTIAVKATKAALTNHKIVTANADTQTAWWRNVVLPGNSTVPAHHRLEDAFERFNESLYLHINTRFLFAGTMGRIAKLAAAAGHPEKLTDVFAAFGEIEEVRLADALWAVAHGAMDRDTFIATYGFHGVNEGNPSGHAWREQPGMLDDLVKTLADRPADQRPGARAAGAAARQRAAVEAISAGLNRRQRWTLQREIKRAAAITRDTEVGKAAFLMTIDGVRSAARDLGRDYVVDGRLEDIDDIFFLSLPEIRDGLSDARTLAEHRRMQWLTYRAWRLPVTFTGMPEPIVSEPERLATGEQLTGVPASAGVVEGRAHIITDPYDDMLDEGEILVCRMTDPSWTPLFTLAEALVIDVGGAGSHGAIVARELGVPCVINTRDGTQRLRNGDRIRVDGGSGTVTVLETATSA